MENCVLITAEYKLKMKVKYSADVDALVIKFSDAIVDESDEEKPGIILDFDKEGNVVRIEILKASQRIGNPQNIEFEVA
jgi:uncharacterized protein YuzE